RNFCPIGFLLLNGLDRAGIAAVCVRSADLALVRGRRATVFATGNRGGARAVRRPPLPQKRGDTARAERDPVRIFGHDAGAVAHAIVGWLVAAAAAAYLRFRYRRERLPARQPRGRAVLTEPTFICDHAPRCAPVAAAALAGARGLDLFDRLLNVLGRARQIAG